MWQSLSRTDSAIEESGSRLSVAFGWVVDLFEQPRGWWTNGGRGSFEKP